MKITGQTPLFSSRICSLVSKENAEVEQNPIFTVCDHELSGHGQRKAIPSQRSGDKVARTWSNTSVNFLTMLFVLVLFCNGAVAQERKHPALQNLARRGELLVDRSPSPDSPHRRVMARGTSKPTTIAPSASPTLVGSSASTSSEAAGAASSSTGIVIAPGSKSSALPQPFDTSIGSNFTSSACPAYFTKFLADPVFQSCYPFSLLIQTSNAFFDAEKSYVRTTMALDAGCNANFAKCNTLMNNIAYKLKQADVCASDFTAQNPIVLQAYNGLVAYQPMYQAGCLKDTSGSYCFANAITQTNSSLSDVYPYWLPLGTDMPDGVRATCDTCLKNTMNIFRAAATNSTQPISKTYIPAAQLINIGCGPEYVTDSIDYRTASSATQIGSGASFASIFGLFTMLVFFLN